MDKTRGPYGQADKKDEVEQKEKPQAISETKSITTEQRVDGKEKTE